MTSCRSGRGKTHLPWLILVVATPRLLAGGTRIMAPKLYSQHSSLFLVRKPYTGIPTVLVVPQVFLTILLLLIRNLLLLSPTWMYRIIILPPPRQREEAAEMNAAKLLRSKINGNLNVKQTSSRGHEIILVSLLGGLMREEGLIPDGTFLDAGAQHGEQGAHFAVAAPDRRVLCLDPSPANVEGMKKEYGELPNLRIEQGGLSTEVGIMKPRDDSFKMDLNETFQLFTLDSLFYNKGEKLGFAHLDVEGLELDVLKGGVETLRAYKPILTTEIRVHDHKYTTELLKFLDKESYDTYIIDEVCGSPHQDLRNLLNIPRSLSRRMAKSDTFNLLHATESIFRVDVDNIFEVVLPCCAQGGECCPGGDLKAATCCDEKSVTNWYTKNNIKMSPASMFGWKNSRKAYETWQYRLRKRSKTP